MKWFSEFNNLNDAQYLNVNSVDLVFLDMKLDFNSGLDLLYQFKIKRFRSYLVTAYKEYAIEALRCSAFDYLLKPVNYVELISAVKSYKLKTNKVS